MGLIGYVGYAFAITLMLTPTHMNRDLSTPTGPDAHALDPIPAIPGRPQKVLCDRVRCSNCSMRAWVVRGADVCPECDTYGTMAWDNPSGEWDDTCTSRERPRVLLPAAAAFVPDVASAHLTEIRDGGTRYVCLYSEGEGEAPGELFFDLHGIWAAPTRPSGSENRGQRHLSPTEDAALFDRLSDRFYAKMEG